MQHNLLSFANNTSVRLDQMFTFSYVKHFYSMGPNFIRRGGLCWQGYSYQRYMLPRVPVFMMGTHLYTEPLSLVPLHLPRLDFKFEGSKGPFAFNPQNLTSKIQQKEANSNLAIATHIYHNIPNITWLLFFCFYVLGLKTNIRIACNLFWRNQMGSPVLRKEEKDL